MGWENLPRTVLMYYTNFVSSPEGYFHTVICNSQEFRNTTVNHDLHYISWDNPPKQHPLSLTVDDFQNMTNSGAAFARKFDREDPVLDKIDAVLLNRGKGRFTPGGWCIGTEPGEDPCALRGEYSVLRPGQGARRFEDLVVRLLHPDNFRSQQCISLWVCYLLQFQLKLNANIPTSVHCCFGTNWSPARFQCACSIRQQHFTPFIAWFTKVVDNCQQARVSLKEPEICESCNLYLPVSTWDWNIRLVYLAFHAGEPMKMVGRTQYWPVFRPCCNLLRADSGLWYSQLRRWFWFFLYITPMVERINQDRSPQRNVSKKVLRPIAVLQMSNVELEIIVGQQSHWSNRYMLHLIFTYWLL